MFPAVSILAIQALRETNCNIKQLHRMAGVSWMTYWGAMYLFDFMVFLIIMLGSFLTAIGIDKLSGYLLFNSKEISINTFFQYFQILLIVLENF